MIAGFLLVLFAYIYIDTKYKKERRDRYERVKAYYAKKKIDGTLEYELAIKAREGILEDINKGKSLEDICKNNDISICDSVNKAAILIARKQVEKQGYFPCIPTDFPLDKDESHIKPLIKSKERLADTFYSFGVFKEYDK